MSDLIRATVTQVSPLLVRVDGASTASTAESFGAPPLVGARVLVATLGSSLIVTGGAADPGWHVVGDAGEPAFTNAWVAYSASYKPRYRKSADGLVTVAGITRNGTMGAAAWTMPVGYRPGDASADFPVVSYNGTAYIFGQVYVLATGAVVPQTGSNVQMDLNFSYYAEA